MSQAGFFLASGGGSAPIFKVTTDGGIATPVGGNINLYANTTVNSGTVKFVASGSTIHLDFEDSNLNMGIGTNSVGAAISGAESNVCIGDSAGRRIATCDDNVALGVESLQELVSGGGENTSIGAGAGANLVSGGLNVFLGAIAGTEYTTSESNNIAINSGGVILDNNTLRIGQATGSGSSELNKAFISGISGVNIGSVANVVSINTATDQLGTTAITAGTGITVTPGANTLTIAASGGGGGALVLIQTQTVAGVTTLDFTTGITPTYNNYLLLGGSITSTLGAMTSALVLQISNDGGATYQMTGYFDFGTNNSSGFLLVESTYSPWVGLVGSFSTNLFDMTSGSLNVSSVTNGYVIDPAGVNTGGFIQTGQLYGTAVFVVNAFRLILTDGSAFSGSFSLYGYTM